MTIADYHGVKRRQTAFDRLPSRIRVALSNAVLKYDDAEIEQMLFRGVPEAQILISIFEDDAFIRGGEERRWEIEQGRKEKRRGLST